MVYGAKTSLHDDVPHCSHHVVFSDVFVPSSQALQRDGVMTSAVPQGWPTPIAMPHATVGSEYLNPAAGQRTRTPTPGSAASSNMTGTPVSVASGGVAPVGPMAGVVGTGPVGYGVGGFIVSSSVPGMMDVRSPVPSQGIPQVVPTVMPSTFVVGKGADADDADSLLIRRRRNFMDREEEGVSNGGGGGEVRASSSTGRGPLSPAMEVLRASIIA